MYIYIYRHGETDLNKQGIVQGKGVDSEINEQGEKQAALFYQKYKKIPFDFIFTSTLIRTHQTVKPFLLNTPSLWIQFAELDEFSWGDHEGKPPTPQSMEVYNAMINAWRNENLHARIPNGESAHELFERLQQFLQKLSLYKAENILICTHGRTLKALISILENKPTLHMEHIQHHNTSLYIYEYEQNRFKQLIANDLTHITD